MFLFILITEYQYLNWPFLLLICIWALQLTFALTLWALALVNCFSLAAGMRMSQSVSRILPSSVCALGKPMIVPCCCWKETNRSDFSVYSFYSHSFFQLFKREKEREGRSISTETSNRSRKSALLSVHVPDSQTAIFQKPPSPIFLRHAS